MSYSENYIKNRENPFLPMTSEARYWIGYIFADGSIAYRHRKYSISLFSKDPGIMQKFKEFIGDKSHMYIRPTGIMQVIYNSKPITKWFVNTFNVGERKALTLDPTIDIDWDILHGYFDGDGSIRLTKYKGKYPRYEMRFTTGSKIWKDRIGDFLEMHGIKTHVSTKGRAFDIIITGKKQLLFMYIKMYGSNTSRLNYKYEQFVALFGDKQLKIG